MRKKSKDLAEKVKILKNEDLKELEELEKIFGNGCHEKIIEGNKVYGNIKGKKEYLGTKSEYEKYRHLKSQKYNKNKSPSANRLEKYNNFNMD